MEKLINEKKVYSVTELTKEIRFILEQAFPHVWVEGEVSNFTHHGSGHCYLSIKDEESILDCVIFKNIADELSFKIEDGMHLVCFGRISVYSKRGRYQLYIEKAEPKGIGALQLAFEQLKKKLFKEGLFDKAHKRPIPMLPEKIGVITSPTGAAIRDILHIMERRFPEMHIILYPVKVQGAGAAEQIVQALDDFNSLKNVDVIILGRGGGSLEDLWAFNEEIVARAIYKSEIPIISAVGHEIDYTISDFCADLRAPTPSVAAEIVAGKKQDFIDKISDLKERSFNALMGMVEFAGHKLQSLDRRYAFKQPQFLVQQRQQRIDELARDLCQGIDYIIEKQNQALYNLKGRLKALSPVSILDRGYSITIRYKDGKIIKDAKTVKKGERIKSRLAKGELISEIK